MIIDCHGHFTTAPQQLRQWREKQVATADDPGKQPKKSDLKISDEEIRVAIGDGQLKKIKERGADLTLFSPIAGQMAHHLGNSQTSADWAEVCNDQIYRVCTMFPENFAGICQLPQSAGVSPANCVAELRRCVEELGFVGCNLNPDPSAGYWSDPPLSDRHWYPLYEEMVRLEVPAMIHVSANTNPCFFIVGDYYINGDTTAFVQLMMSDLFEDFPTLKFVIPHGGGAVAFHWARYRGLSLDVRKRPLEKLMNNVFFDTCVYHQPGIDFLADVIPSDNLLFGSEMLGAVPGIDPKTGHFFDDTKRYVDACPLWDEVDRSKIYESNVRRVYPRLDAALKEKGK